MQAWPTVCVVLAGACAGRVWASTTSCGAGFYLDGEAACLACPEDGTRCTVGGATLASLPLAPGYWRASASSAEVFACRLRSDCDGGAAFGRYCARGREGSRCGACDEESTRDVAGRCRRCARSLTWRVLAPRCLAWAGVLASAVFTFLRRDMAVSRWKMAAAFLQTLGAATAVLEEGEKVVPPWFVVVGAASRALNLDGDALLPLHCVLGRGVTSWEALVAATLGPVRGGKRVQKSQLHRLLSRSISTRFG